MIFIGIDPGAAGALCAIDDTRKILLTYPFDHTDGDFPIEMVVEHLKELTARGEPYEIVLEKVHSMPGQGVVSMFSFGQNYGTLIGILRTMGLPYQNVRPQAWQKEVHIGSDLTKAKERSYWTAKRLWPEADFLKSQRARKPHSGIIDALLLAEFGKRFVSKRFNP